MFANWRNAVMTPYRAARLSPPGEVNGKKVHSADRLELVLLALYRLAPTNHGSEDQLRNATASFLSNTHILITYSMYTVYYLM